MVHSAWCMEYLMPQSLQLALVSCLVLVPRKDKWSCSALLFPSSPRPCQMPKWASQVTGQCFSEAENWPCEQETNCEERQRVLCERENKESGIAREGHYFSPIPSHPIHHHNITHIGTRNTAYSHAHAHLSIPITVHLTTATTSWDAKRSRSSPLLMNAIDRY